MRAHFSSKSLVAIIQWDDIFKVLGEKLARHPQILFPVKICFKKEGEIQIFQATKSERFHCQQT